MEDRDVETEEHATLKLVASAYGVAIKPERFGDLLAAWDAWSDSILRDEGLAYREISSVFQEALLASERLNNTQEEKDLLDQVASPAILLDKAHNIVSHNASTRALLDEEGVDCATLIATSSKPFVTLPETARRAYRMTGPGTLRSFLAVETPLGQNLKSAYPLAETVVRLSSIDWTPVFAADLSENLNLSAAETRVARGLLEGRTAQEIAGHLGRSVATIRSHIKVLLKKTGARRQTELVQFLTILRQVAEARPSPQVDATMGEGFVVRDITRDTGMLRTIRYGAGHSVLYFTTSSRPQENSAVRDAFASAGLQVIAPCRPGFGGSDPVRGDSSDVLCADWLDDLREACGGAL
ncbi:helix-turn-helix transcriptional regulator [Yoonia sp. GPGPB17]|uniref:helix-turn-helix transcriptional regulator n=1 Tax=Yoonia sp. GPGPB17 TaxID=3026147 RepID=UPI0030C323AD